MEEKEIEFKNIGKGFNGRTVFSGISFEIRRGEIVGLTGASGIGKTTLLRIAAGLERPDEGELYLHGIKTDPGVPANRRGAAVVFQEPVLWNRMTVEANIRYAMGGAGGKSRDGKIQRIADSLGIGDLLSRYPAQISGGQAKRVSLARAFASDQSIFLLDEPLSNLDDSTKGTVLELMKKEFAGRKAVLYITHDSEEARVICGRIFRLGQEGVLECEPE